MLNMDIHAILEKLYIWQIFLIMGFILLGMGFTGESDIIGGPIIAGKENLAIGLGVLFSILAVLLKMLPSPEPQKESDEEPARPKKLPKHRQ